METLTTWNVGKMQVVVPLLIALLIVTSPAYAEQSGDATSIPCTPSWALETHPLTRGLKEIIFYFRIRDPILNQALACHGKEASAQCLLFFGDRDSPNNETAKQQIVSRLKATYDDYPKALLPEPLTAQLVEVVKSRLEEVRSSWTPTEGGPVCPLPQVTVINNAPANHCVDVTTPAEEVSCAVKRVPDYINDANNLTILVEIQFFPTPLNGNQMKPTVALLTTRLYRAGCGCSCAYDAEDGEQSFAIPLNIGDKAIADYLKYFKEGVFSAPLWKIRDARRGPSLARKFCNETKSK
jgi:hypothetical protein